MRAAPSGSTVTAHQRSVTGRMEAGESFGDVEDAIDEITDLNDDQKSALWLWAFSLRDANHQQRDALSHLAAVR